MQACRSLLLGVTHCACSRNSQQNLATPQIPYLLYDSFPKAIEALAADPKISRIYVMGGSYIYDIAMKSALCTYVLLTKIYKDFECDVFFPPVDETIYERVSHEELEKFVGEDLPEGVQVENGIPFEFMMYKRKE